MTKIIMHTATSLAFCPTVGSAVGDVYDEAVECNTNHGVAAGERVFVNVSKHSSGS